MKASKLVPFKNIASKLKSAKRARKKIVFTNGTFDLLHRGHVEYLESARTMGDILVVGLNTDASVKSYKGPKRPVNPQRDRAMVLSALACVDYIVLFGDSTPIRLIKEIKPDVLVKGADWKLCDIVGRAEVESWGGRVKRIKYLKGHSTTGILKKLGYE